MDEEAKPYETMNSDRLSAEEKEKQKAADDDDLPPALVLQSAGEGEPASGDAAAAANWHTDAGAGVRRQLLFCGTPPTSEIEELPPSPPRPAAPSSGPGRLPALTDAADASAVPVPEGLQEALESRLLKLVRLRREREALEEFWKPVVPERHPRRRQCTKSKVELEHMEALEEFWKPVVPQRYNSKSKINWNHIIIITLIALTNGLVPYIFLWTLLPVNSLSHINGTMSTRLIHVCFWSLVLYALYLILRHIHGLLGKHQ